MLKKIVIVLVVVIAIVYGVALGYLYLNQRAFFFSPAGDVIEIADTAFSGEVVSIPTENGQSLTGWYSPGEDGMPTILYYKGNSGSFTSEHERYAAFSGAGYGVLAFDYRGFPTSPGEITQDNMLADALAAFDWLDERTDDILIWGRSLGASPAVWVASQRDAEAVLLETPFYSAVNVASERYPYVPVGLLMFDQFPSNEWIGDVEEPVFVAHGTADATISVSNAERLYAEIPNPADLWIEDGAGHSDLWRRGIWDRAQVFFNGGS
ncbi:alpha/beta hydrolase [Pelagibacterium xiamenense]|uniref:alpha/beta hydrolase n=1 Tax=Pelagibacterium xiamenense TaxID=2901140 RepID=UPI001E5CD5F9|nr:alpha/beta hydrolase [Pelagibacterium xiamenense]MCD7060500.1 alpha/beta hydrolase [Pelagibacterium xiamenense]